MIKTLRWKADKHDNWPHTGKWTMAHASPLYPKLRYVGRRAFRWLDSLDTWHSVRLTGRTVCRSSNHKVAAYHVELPDGSYEWWLEEYLDKLDRRTWNRTHASEFYSPDRRRPKERLGELPPMPTV